MRSKSLIVSALATTLLAAAVSAQPAGGARALRARAHAFRALDLSDAQKEQMKALRERQREALKAKAEAIRAEATKLRELTEADSPDALAVGQATLKIRALRREMTDARKAAHEEFLAILTPEQKQKLEDAKDRRGFGRGRNRGIGE